MFYWSTTHAFSVSECIKACDNTISNDFKQKCNACVGSVELSAQMCIKACGNTAFDQYRAICSRCTGRPPINFDMCAHACDNTYHSQFRHICDQCVGQVETSEDMCWKACRNTAHHQFRRICSRCPQKYRGDLWTASVDHVNHLNYCSALSHRPGGDWKTNTRHAFWLHIVAANDWLV